MNLVSTAIGYPYIGEQREWKRNVEAFWGDAVTEKDFLAAMKTMRLQQVKRQQALGLELITVGDFTFYDRMLDHAAMFGLIPARYDWTGGEVDLQTYYAMSRGAKSIVACEMTKWFNTNYHYIVPEYEGQKLKLTNNYILDYFVEAKEELGILTKPTLIGPFTFVELAKGYDEKTKANFLLQILPLYIEIINQLVDAGAQWIQLEEPALVKTLSLDDVKLVQEIYRQLSEATPQATIMLQTYFEALSHYEQLIQLPVQGFGLDFVHGYEENMASLRQYGFPKEKTLGIGIINGRDIWRANLAERTSTIQAILLLSNAEQAWIQSSCSLQHVPVTVACETKIDTVLKEALAFSDEKIVELDFITNYVRDSQWVGNKSVSESMLAIEALNHHNARNNTVVQQLVKQLTMEDFRRDVRYKKRQELQKQALQLPLFPTTTIGSFPQSSEVKKTRAAWRKKQITDEQYAEFVKQETARWIRIQEDIGLDVFVHGEFERTDMVEFFGEKLDGFAFTQNAWVVSYGSRCVKPPIIYGDVAWTSPMTVKEVVEAQQLTNKFVKGMLTGPITILNWSFVRDDVSRQEVAYQIALALRQEIDALESANIKIIQVDEPALREGLPLRKNKQQDYLEWGINAFKLATSKVATETQIHTHMCYCEFNDFMKPIRALDADVISIETSRSHGELIQALRKNEYDLGIGLGVYDIHSPRIPTIEEMEKILTESVQVIGNEQFWVNPDCGLKTRGEEETIASLLNMVAAAKVLRSEAAPILK